MSWRCGQCICWSLHFLLQPPEATRDVIECKQSFFMGNVALWTSLVGSLVSLYKWSKQITASSGMESYCSHSHRIATWLFSLGSVFSFGSKDYTTLADTAGVICCWCVRGLNEWSTWIGNCYRVTVHLTKLCLHWTTTILKPRVN